MKAKILKLLLSAAMLLPFAPTNVMAAPDGLVAYGEAGVEWAVDVNGILYIQAGEMQKVEFWQLIDVQSIREIRVVPTKDCKKLILPEDCWALFWNFRNLTEIDTRSFDTSYVRDMYGMFSFCCSLKKLDLSSFDTSNVIDMGSMFSNCSSLETLDLSSFDTSSVKNMRWTFGGCSSLETLDLSSFGKFQIKNQLSMFEGCCRLKNVIRNFSSPLIISHDHGL